ncbi:MAG: UDP-glucose--hexose-1-phosphate uridylyltransferase [Ruminiclostridium sp.]
MICSTISELIEYAVSNSLIEEIDSIYIRNTLMDALGVSVWEEQECHRKNRSIDEILGDLVDYACEKGIIRDSGASRDLFDTRLMGILTPLPSGVNRKFRRLLSENPAEATEWYYDFSAKTNYVRAGRIARDIRWTYGCDYGVLDITINRSKPEKDPRDIAAAKNSPKTSYPACQLCIENTGFAGTLTHPARQNLRPVEMQVNGEKWWFQYSPYGYYNEHCIVFNDKHIPMQIDAAVFEKLFDIIDTLPHYFVGSNADLPIVGGSILSHEHFQGGRYIFPMEKAPIETEFALEKYPKVKAGILKWAMSVIRVSCEDRKQLAAACDHILRSWRKYSDTSAEIYAETNGTPHNTITPIARMRNGVYECDLVLRNNRTTEDRPLGLFHPNPTLHHIKKENIGLIEVMGLAVLPARLAEELPQLSEALVSGRDISADERLGCHADWLKEVASRHSEANAENAEAIIKQEIGAVFEQVLLDAGVFKRTEAGKAAFMRFVEQVKG